MRYLVLVSILILAQPQTQQRLEGKWMWQGVGGWQRLVLDLKVQGSILTGTLWMGPGGAEPKSPNDYWEYFFDPTAFKIANGKVQGNTISFEHEAQKTIPTVIGRPFVLPAGARGVAAVQGAPKPSPGKFIYRGVFNGDKIVLTRETVARDGDPWVVGKHKVEISLEPVK